MPMRPSVRDAMLAAVPSLRAFAISLCGNVDRADDLVQETLVRAMANIDSFQPGTNMSAWLFTILQVAKDCEHVGMAVHNPSQPVSLRVPQAAARSGRHRRRLCRDTEVASGAAKP